MVSDGLVGRLISGADSVCGSFRRWGAGRAQLPPEVKSASGLTNGSLRGQAVVVLDAAEDGQCHARACLRRWPLQFGVRIWDPVNRLRRPGPVVILNVPRDDVTDVIDAEEDEVIRSLAPQRPHEAFDMRRRIGRSVRGRQSLDSHDFVQPRSNPGLLRRGVSSQTYNQCASMPATANP